MLGAGQYNRRVEIQQRIPGTDSYGQQSTGWQTVATVWASVRARSARQQELSASTQSAVTHTVAVRYSAALAALAGHALRITITGGRVLDVTGGYDWDERHEVIIYECVEVSPA